MNSKKRSFSGIGLGALLSILLAGSVGPLRPGPQPPRKTISQEFRDPPAHYGPIHCWWWEGGRLSREKMRWQLAELKAKGVSGTWFYPRFPGGAPLGSDPPYWNSKWWDFTRFSMEEHRRLGLLSWFSDWTAHQFFQDQVREESRRRPELVGRRLAVHEALPGTDGLARVEVPPQEEILDAAAYQKSGEGLRYDSRTALAPVIQNRKLEWKAPAGNWIVVVVTAQPYDLDYLNRLVADRFLAVSLERYRQELPGSPGRTLQAYGPDEMYLLMGNILYSPAVLARVQAEKGYDLTPYLGGLFYDVGARTDKIRCEYFDAMSALLEENFYKPISQWLSQHGMKYVTIATWGRENLLEQTLHYGDFFRYMRWFHITGNEDPGPGAVGQRRFIDSKLSSSIAHLNERERVAVCAYWGAGWGMSLEQNLAWTNENYAYGVNLYNQHGGVFGLMGGWYEWVPPEVDFYQPYWRHWKHFADYVRRLSYIMSQGRHRADVALLYPSTTLHANWHGTTEPGPLNQKKVLASFSPEAREAGETTLSLMKQIYGGGIDLDVIDHGSVEGAQAEGGRLRAAGLEFRAIVLPPMTTIRTATLSRIRDFYQDGGTVVACGRLPRASAENGRDDPAVRAMLRQIFGTEAPAAIQRNQNDRGGRAFFLPGNDARVVETIASAIVPDVKASDKDIFHAHRKAADLEVYFLFNARSEARAVSVQFRAAGDPEIWDPWTGDITPVHRFQRSGDTTTVRLDMDPYQGIVVVLNGSRSQRAVQESAQATAAPSSRISLDGPFEFRLEPTMNNRWGDFRHPPSDTYIGAEARRFRYQPESGQPGAALGWHSASFDDSSWPLVTYSYGPYWWHLGPFDESKQQQSVAAEPDVTQPHLVGSESHRWQPYIFSKKFGYPGHEIHSDFRQGSLLGVSENFFVFEAPKGIPNAAHYLFTWVHASEEAEYQFRFGGGPEKGDFEKGRHPIVFEVPLRREAWVNGRKVVSIQERHTEEVRQTVHLQKGSNAVLLKLVHPKDRKIATYAVFQDPAPEVFDRYVPLLRWFQKPQRVTYDISPRLERRAGWYRFKAPPGLKALRFTSDAESIEAWVDGASLPVGAGEVVLPQAKRGVSQVTLRVRQKPGSYAGAAFQEPVVFECSQGQIALGDWSTQGLANYSGIGVYRRTVMLEKAPLKEKVFLDVGRVATVAEVFVNGKAAGVRMARPFRFDVTKLLRKGPNELEVKVANTLANHMSTYPTKFVFEGQTVSGLLGPAELQFLPEITLQAAR